MFGAITGGVKIGMAVAALLGGIMLKVSGFDVAVQNAQPANPVLPAALRCGGPALTSLAAIS